MIPILNQQPQAAPMVEVCRSFSYKLNLQNHGGPAYESADFFASRKVQCAAEDMARVSQQAYEECVAEVRACMAAFVAEMKRKAEARKRPALMSGNAREFENWKENGSVSA